MIIILDQYSKAMALSYCKKKGNIIFIKGLLKLQIVKNTGAAFGIFRNKNKMLTLIIIPIIFILTYLLIIASKIGATTIEKMAISLIVGGAIGNLIDRIKKGYVVDFIYIYIRRFPVFNIADLSIFVGGIMIFISELK